MDKAAAGSSTAPESHFTMGSVVESFQYINASRFTLPPPAWRSAMLVRRILPFAIAAATACPAWSQVSSAIPPQTIGTLSTDREPPTDLQQVQQLIVSKR